jgi:hypothetical protein
MVAHVCNTNTQEAEEGLQVPGQQPQLNTKTLPQENKNNRNPVSPKKKEKERKKERNVINK